MVIGGQTIGQIPRWGGEAVGGRNWCRAAGVGGGDIAPGAGDAENHTAEFKEIARITRIPFIHSSYGRQNRRGIGEFLRTR